MRAILLLALLPLTPPSGQSAHDLPPKPPSSASHPAAFAAFRFTAEEGWTLEAHGPAGTSELRGRMLRLDFTQGATAFSVRPLDRPLQGKPETFQLRIHGSVPPLPVDMILRTPSASFEKALGMLEGDGHLELNTSAPPGPGWIRNDIENDDRLPGHLRVSEIRFRPPKSPRVIELELEEIMVQTTREPDQRNLTSPS